MKMEILEKTRDMEAGGSILQDLADKRVAPNLRTLVKREVDRRKSLMIFGLEKKKVIFRPKRNG